MLLLEYNCVSVSKLEVLYPFPSFFILDHRFNQEMKTIMIKTQQDVFLRCNTFLSLCRNGAGREQLIYFVIIPSPYILLSCSLAVTWQLDNHSQNSLSSSSSPPSLSFHCFTLSTQFSRSVVSDSLRPHELQHARPPCPSPSPLVHSDSRPSSA